MNDKWSMVQIFTGFLFCTFSGLEIRLKALKLRNCSLKFFNSEPCDYRLNLSIAPAVNSTNLYEADFKNVPFAIVFKFYFENNKS